MHPRSLARAFAALIHNANGWRYRLEVCLHKIDVSVSILNKTFANMRYISTKVSCAGPHLVLDMRLLEAGEGSFGVRL